MNEINICLSCDNKYAVHAGVLIASILSNAYTDDILNIYIFDGNIDKNNKDKILSLASIKECNISFIKVNNNLFNEYKKIKTHDYISLAAYYRLKAASLLPNLDKVIYFDCDVVVNCSLSSLYQIDIQNFAVAGVNDINKKIVKQHPNYINSGVLLINLKLWRQKNIESKLLQFTQDNSDNIKTGDQEIINRCLSDSIKIINNRWNVQSSNFTNRSSYIKNPNIVHFVSKKKPWQKASYSYHRNLYFKYLQLTPWELNEKDYKYWVNYNQLASLISYVFYRPLFFLRPKFYYAIYKSYFEKDIKNFVINRKHFFLFKDIDSHYVIHLFWIIQLKIKHKIKFNYICVNSIGVNKNDERKIPVIVSLTSFPERMNSVEKTLNTLLNQTLKPDRLILWLAEKQFKNKEFDIPEKILNLKNYGLEIKWCEDLKSYKKLIPALREYPDSIIVTADDDIYYQKDWLESLYSSYLKNPDCIHARRVSRGIIKNKQFYLNSLLESSLYNFSEPGYLNQQSGGAGCLYPPHTLHKNIFNTELFMSKLPTHDDIYFWAMAVLNKTKICEVIAKDKNIYNVENSQKFGLCKINNNRKGMSANEAFKIIFSLYPEIQDLLINNK